MRTGRPCEPRPGRHCPPLQASQQCQVLCDRWWQAEQPGPTPRGRQRARSAAAQSCQQAQQPAVARVQGRVGGAATARPYSVGRRDAAVRVRPSAAGGGGDTCRLCRVPWLTAFKRTGSHSRRQRRARRSALDATGCPGGRPQPRHPRLRSKRLMAATRLPHIGHWRAAFGPAGGSAWRGARCAVHRAHLRRAYGACEHASCDFRNHICSLSGLAPPDRRQAGCFRASLFFNAKVPAVGASAAPLALQHPCWGHSF